MNHDQIPQETEQKEPLIDDAQNKTTHNTPLLLISAISEPLPKKTDHLRIDSKLHHQSSRSYSKSPNPHQPQTPVENLLMNFDSCVLFTPVDDDDDNKSETTEIETITSDWVLKQYYPTTSCSALCLRTLRFIRMACVVLPILSMIGPLFTHTQYVDFVMSTAADLWALSSNIKPNSPLANTLGGLTVGVITLIMIIFLVRFLWVRLIKKKFLTSCKIGLKSIKADIEKILFNKNQLADELEKLGLIGKKSDAILIQYNTEQKTAQDCYLLYFKYLSLVQRYNTDRMGPYDIAKERLASQLRVFSIFLLLVIGIYNQSDTNKNTFEGRLINYGKIYSLIIGALKDAQIRSMNDHQKSPCFHWLKTCCTQSHYALMLEQLLEDETDNENDDSMSLYNDCFKKSMLFHSLIIGAEATSKFVKDDDNIMETRESRIRTPSHQL
jgi:hypothetical protein